MEIRADDIERSAPTICRNCEVAFEGSFCHNCGQARFKRQQLRGLLSEFLRTLLFLDVNVYRTLLHLIRRPGIFLNDYLQGKQGNYAGPVHFFIFNLGIYVLVFISFGDNVFDYLNSSIVNVDGSEDAQRINEIQSYVKINLNYLYFMLPMTMAFFIKLFFNNRKWSYAESLVIASYLVGSSLFFSSVIFLISLLNPQLIAVRLIIIGLLLPVWLMQTGQKPGILGYFRGLGTTILGYMCYALLVVILTLMIT